MSVKRLIVFMLGAAVAAASAYAETKGRAVLAPDKFTATTTAMTPSDIQLRIHIREWSTDDARAAAVAAMGDTENAQKALQALPTLGHVWQSGSPVGYAVKYAHRTPTPQGERVTFVTDRRLGSYEFKPWTAERVVATELPYSVIELYLDSEGKGAGTFSLAAEVEVDAAGSLVSLKADAPRLLTNAKLEPKPYWAKEQ